MYIKFVLYTMYSSINIFTFIYSYIPSENLKIICVSLSLWCGTSGNIFKIKKKNSGITISLRQMRERYLFAKLRMKTCQKRTINSGLELNESWWLIHKSTDSGILRQHKLFQLAQLKFFFFKEDCVSCVTNF